MPGRPRLSRFITGVVSVNPPSIGAGVASNVDLTQANADWIGELTTDHQVFADASGLIEAGLICLSAYVPSNGTLRLRIYNPTAGAIDGAAFNWAVFGFLVR